MRNPLKRHPSDETKPALRERLAATKAKAACLAAEPDKGRRAVLAGSLAAAVPLPALAAPDQPSTREAAILALVPELLPLLRRLAPARDEAQRLYEAAETAAGAHPGWHNDEAGSVAWVARLDAARTANGYEPAWEAADALGATIAARVNPFLNEPMRTLPGIALKTGLAALGEWWFERAMVDLDRLAAERFGLPFDEPEPFDLAVPEDDTTA